MSSLRKIRIAPALAGAFIVAGASCAAHAQVYVDGKPLQPEGGQGPSAAADSPGPSGMGAVQPAVARMLKVPEGAEVRVKLGERLSSATSAEGDTFSFVLEEPIELPDGSVVPAGYVGRGEVVQVDKAGMVGKPGQLNVRLEYLKIGSTHVRLRANKGGQSIRYKGYSSAAW